MRPSSRARAVLAFAAAHGGITDEFLESVDRLPGLRRATRPTVLRRIVASLVREGLLTHDRVRNCRRVPG